MYDDVKHGSKRNKSNVKIRTTNTMDEAEVTQNHSSINSTSSTMVVIGSSVLSALLLCILFLNALLSYVLYQKSHLHTPSNRFVFSLALANVVFCMLSLPFNIVSCVMDKWIFGVMWCNVTGFITLCVLTGGIFTVACISIDRYYAIVKPMLYPFKITNTRTVELICCSWVLAILLTIPPFFGWSRFVFHKSKLGCMVDWRHHRSYAAVYIIVGAVLPTAVIIVCYHHIFKAARISSRRVSNGNVVDTKSPTRRRSRRASLLVSIRMNSPTKALRTILLTLIITFIFWLPFVFNGLIEIMYKSIEIPVFIHSVIVLLLCCTFLAQPCIYGLWNKTIRRQIKSIMFGTSISFDGEDERVFYQRRQSRGASITGSITDLSYTALLQSRPGVATISGCSVHQSSNDSGAVLACIQEADDSDKSLNNSLNTSKSQALSHSIGITKHDPSTCWKKDVGARRSPSVRSDAREHPSLHHVDANSEDEGIDNILETVNLDD